MLPIKNYFLKIMIFEVSVKLGDSDILSSKN